MNSLPAAIPDRWAQILNLKLSNMKRLLKKWSAYFKQLDWKSSSRQLLPYAITIITGVLTFFMYAYFNRDKVNIESVLVRPKELLTNIDLTLASKLSTQLNDRYIERTENSTYDLTNLDKNFLLLTLKRLYDKSSGYQQKLTEYKDKLIKLNEISEDSLTQDEFEKLGINIYSSFEEDDVISTTGKKEIKIPKKDIRTKYFLKPIETTANLKLKVDDVIKQLIQKTKKALEENIDKFQIEVIAFNEGNTQTVIRHKGTLELGSTQLNLKKSDNQKIEDYYTKLSNAMSGKSSAVGSSSNYIIIEPRSFIVLNIEIDNFNNKNRDIDVIKREYVSGQSLVKITLFDIKNNPLKPFKFKLQNDVENDPNEELNKFISENLFSFAETP